MEYLIQLLMVFFGSLGFALVFQVRREKLILAGVGGLLSWATYLLATPWIRQDVLRYFVASAVVAVYAEILARLVKCPATTFLIPGAVTLVPGGSLYQSMRFFMDQDYSAFSAQAFQTLLYAVSIAVGMLFPMSVFQLIRRRQQMAGKTKR